MEAKRKRTDLPFTRSTTGCRTCKIRRIRCDEKEPCCQRCLSTGRKCDGVRSRHALRFHPENQTNIKTFAPAISTRVNQYLWLVSSTERQVFGHYLERVAPFLSGSLDKDLWSVLVPQLARKDDAIKFSVLAISEFFAHPVDTPQNSELLTRSVSTEHLKALRWYSKALATHRRSDFTVFHSDILVKTVMFVSLEIQQNNIAAGLRLLKLAFSMVAPLLTAGCIDCGIRSAPDSITGIVLPIFMRSAGMLFSPWSGLHDRINFARMSTELVETVFWILCMVWTLFKDFYILYRTDVTSAQVRLQVQQSELKRALSLARDKARLLHKTEVSDLQQADVLQDYCNLGLDWLEAWMQMASTVSEVSRSILDSVLSRLASCNDHASKMYPAAARTMFFHQMAILPLTYMVAVVANDDEDRRRALALMNCPSVQIPYTQVHAIVLPSQTGLTTSETLPNLKQRTPTEHDSAESYFLQSNLAPSSGTANMAYIKDPARNPRLQRPVWLTGDMLHVYPERRVVMTEIP